MTLPALSLATAMGRTETGSRKVATSVPKLTTRRRRPATAERMPATRVPRLARTAPALRTPERSPTGRVRCAHRRDAGMVELEREMARAKRLKQAFTLAFVDVDDLKNTNDSLGHVAGDW